MKALMDLKDLIIDEIRKINKKADLTPSELESAYYAVDTIKCIDEVTQNEQGSEMSMDEYSQGMSSRRDPMMRRMSYDDSMDSYGNSYRRGRSMRTGRYVSRDGSYDSYGYGNSYDAVKDKMVQKLERMLDKSPDPQTKEAIEKCIDELE